MAERKLDRGLLTDWFKIQFIYTEIKFDLELAYN